jgi:hypothetical protein
MSALHENCCDQDHRRLCSRLAASILVYKLIEELARRTLRRKKKRELELAPAAATA